MASLREISMWEKREAERIKKAALTAEEIATRELVEGISKRAYEIEPTPLTEMVWDGKGSWDFAVESTGVSVKATAPYIQMGPTEGATKEINRGIEMILSNKDIDSEVKVAALQLLREVLKVDHNTITNCNFNTK